MAVSRRVVLGAGAAAIAQAAPADAAGSGGAVPAAVEAAVRRSIEADGAPGVVVAAARDGRIEFAGGYGLADLDRRSPATPRSVFRIGSLTKQFTAAAVVKLAAEGRLALDDPASRHLKFLQPLPSFTLRELMNHTAGLKDGEDDNHAGSTAKPRSSLELARAVAGQPKPFDFPPGSAWLYSNANYVLLGAVLEAATGRPLDEALASLIFRPLALTSLAVDRAAAVVKDRAQGYTQADPPARFKPADAIEVFEAGGAGAMRGTAPDLCRWHQALLAGRLFAPRWLEEMLTPGRLRDGRLSGANRFSPDDASYGETQYGLGLLLPPAGPHGRSMLHYGYINGFSACLETSIERKLTLAILCNADVGPNLPFRAARRAVFDA